MKDLKITETKRVINANGDIVYEAIPISKDVKKSKDDNTELSGDQKVELYAKGISEGAAIVKKVIDIVQLREQTDATLKTMDKQIELVERTTEAEIQKMIAKTDNWEKRFKMVSKLLQEMTITVTTNKDLHPEIAKSLIDTVKAIIVDMSKGE